LPSPSGRKEVPPSDDLHGTVASLSGGPTITSLWPELTGREMTDATLAWPADVFALVGHQQADVLLLQWPLHVRTRDFHPVPGSVRRAENEPFGVFEFASAEPFDLDLVERTIRGVPAWTRWPNSSGTSGRRSW
jgi:hypothetical protein